MLLALPVLATPVMAKEADASGTINISTATLDELIQRRGFVSGAVNRQFHPDVDDAKIGMGQCEAGLRR